MAGAPEPIDPDRMAETIDHVAVTRLQQAYADGVTRRDWPAVAALFLPDAVVTLDLVTRPPMEHVGPEALTSFVAAAIERFDFFEFVILNAHIELWPGDDRSAATARVFMCELRHDPAEGERSEAFGLYRDTYRKVDGTWRIAARRYRSMARFPAGEVFPLDT
ncbi:nuclear transport factor 2 family protein [Aquihabitans sp. McL0605]|uniref:nuclear transport factor 2 family protein n=1 Tax=Aquihabitans sp. McL0605 TaxID=3415671 RepID=UPI003CFA982F